MKAENLEKTGASGICLDGRENHGSRRGKLLHKGAYSRLTAHSAQSEFNLFVSQFPLAGKVKAENRWS